MLKHGEPISTDWLLAHYKVLAIRRPIGIAASSAFHGWPLVKWWNELHSETELFDMRPEPGFFDDLACYYGWKVQAVNEYYEDYLPPTSPEGYEPWP